MTTSYQPYEPGQRLLLPPALQEWLPKGHLAHFISDTIDALDLKGFYKRYEGGGSRNQPFHPAMMVKVLMYGYATGVFSSRKIARKLHEDIAFRVLAAGNFPKHPDAERLSRTALEGDGRIVRAGSQAGPGMRAGQAGHDSGGRHQVTCQGEQAQSDELRADASRTPRPLMGRPARRPSRCKRCSLCLWRQLNRSQRRYSKNRAAQAANRASPRGE